MAIKSVSRFLIPFVLSLGAWAQGVAWEYLPINSEEHAHVRSGLWFGTSTTSPFPVEVVISVDGQSKTFAATLDPNRQGQALLKIPSEIMSLLMNGSHRAEIRSINLGGTAAEKPMAQRWYGERQAGEF